MLLFRERPGPVGFAGTVDAFLVGVGSLGTALIKYPGFDKAGARIVAAFDCDPAKTGLKVGDTAVLPLDKFTDLARRMHISVGILTVPPMILIDQQGKVVSRNMAIADVEAEVKKLSR